MTDNSGFAAYALWNAIKLHFSSNYDYFKYNGKSNVTKTTFSTRKDKYSFYKLSRRYSLDELKQYYIANLLVKDSQWIGDIIGQEGEENYKNWQKRNQSLTYTFETDTMYLFDTVDMHQMLSVPDGGYPKLLGQLMEENISIETVIIMNDLMNFLPMWERKITDDLIWPQYLKKLKKYTPFVLYQKEKCKQILKEKIKDAET